jgi:hypothetical protein
MMTIKIDGRYGFRTFDQIIKGVAPAGRDRQDPGMRVKPESEKINPRIFPDLVIDKGVKPGREKLLLNSLL